MNATKNPLVSVVIPTYNCAHFLGRALQSVLGQTYANWEVIVIDNYSQDNTDEVVRGLADPRITLLKIHNNGVIASSRNMGIRAAIGEWIAFLDADDWWTPNKLQACIGGVNDEVDFIYHDLKVVSKSNQRFSFRKSRSRALSKDAYGDLLSNGNAMPNSSVVVRKALLLNLGGISENREKIAWEDFDTWIRLARTGCRFKKVWGSYGYYWVGAGNVSSSSRTLANIASFVNCYIQQYNPAVSTSIPWWCHYSSAICYQQLNDSALSESHFLKAWQAKPAWRDRLRIVYKWLFMKIV